MNRDETRRTYREILDAVVGHAIASPPAGITPSNEAPLTCEFCKNAPATDLLVADWPTDRIKHLVCVACGDRAPADAARLNLPIWRFPLDSSRSAGEVPQRPVMPSRFSATPADIDRYLRRVLAEDTYLRYQRTIGDRSVEEAARDLRMEVAAGDASGAWGRAADHIDPAQGGGHYPSQLLCSRHNGFGPCPGAPQCTPRSDDKEDGSE